MPFLVPFDKPIMKRKAMAASCRFNPDIFLLGLEALAIAFKTHEIYGIADKVIRLFVIAINGIAYEAFFIGVI